jgi:hypothetical protein
MHGAIPPLPEYAFMAWCLVEAQGQLYLYLYAIVVWYVKFVSKYRTDKPSNSVGTFYTLKLQRRRNCVCFDVSLTTLR